MTRTSKSKQRTKQIKNEMTELIDDAKAYTTTQTHYRPWDEAETQTKENQVTKTSKSKRRTQQRKARPAVQTDSEVTLQEAPEVPVVVAEAQDDSRPNNGGDAPTAPAKGRRKPKEPVVKKARVEHEPIVNLDPADEIKPVRTGTQLADVLALTARPEGATAVELDKAIVTTAKSVKHYGIWSLRNALHKQKGFGFRTVEIDGEPARYLLVLPKGQTLNEFLNPTKATSQVVKLPRSKRTSKRRGKAAGSEGDADLEPA